jgi:hypothetical protein
VAGGGRTVAGGTFSPQDYYFLAIVAGVVRKISMNRMLRTTINSTAEVGMGKVLEVKKVITPIDFSDNSKLIAESAAYLAGKFGASLHLIFVVQNFEDYSGFFVPQMSMPNLEQDLIAGAEEKMASFCADLQESFTKAGISEVTHQVAIGRRRRTDR